jgi:hypothetical protein
MKYSGGKDGLWTLHLRNETDRLFMKIFVILDQIPLARGVLHYLIELITGD